MQVTFLFYRDIRLTNTTSFVCLFSKKTYFKIYIQGGRMMKFPRWSIIAALALGVLVLGYGAYLLFIKHRNGNRIEQTLAIIKPDAVRAKNSGKIIDRIEQEGFTIIDLKKVQLDKEGAEKFYEALKNKKFFNDLVNFMTSGPVIVMILEKQNAIQAWRDFMGSTNPAEAKEGTIRKQFGSNIEQNAAHGSDSSDAAKREIKFFFFERIKD